MAVKFQPLTDFVLGKYFADEAAFVKMFSDIGMSPFPAPKDDAAPTKTWNAPANGSYKWGGEDRPGYLTVVEGHSVKVIDQSGRGEQHTWTTPIVPPQLGQLLTNAQHDFYVEYRHHADYEQGIPLLGVANWYNSWATPERLAAMNFSSKLGWRHLPPLDHGKLMSYGMRFRPGSTAKRLEDVEVFLIEDYRREFKPPAAQPKPVGEYKYDEQTLAKECMMALAMSGLTVQAGRVIRDLAEARK